MSDHDPTAPREIAIVQAVSDDLIVQQAIGDIVDAVLP